MMTHADDDLTALLALCDAHYTRTRRVVTVLAVPPGTIERINRRLEAADDVRFPGNAAIILRTRRGVASLEELAGCDHPEVLSDASADPSRPPPPSPLFVFWNAGWGWTKWKHIERLPEATHTWCGKPIPAAPAVVQRDSVAATTEICRECLLAYSHSI